MRPILSSTIAMIVLSMGSYAQTAPDAAEMTKLLKDFLDGASRNDAVMHDRFWAEDLIYTGSSGRRIGKADIMRDLRPSAASRTGEPATAYTAEDIRIQQYGNTAIVAFRLVGTTPTQGRTVVANYFNTGTFLKRNGKWQAVSWQATRIPRSDEDARKEVSEVEADFHRAILAADIKKLESVADDSFVWTHSGGEGITRKDLLDQLSSGRLKYSRLETRDVMVSLFGDAAVVRGVSPRQRSAMPGSDSGDAGQLTVFYTLTFINRNGAWKAVAMHTSRQ